MGERSYIETEPVLEATAKRGLSVLAGEKCKSGIAEGYDWASMRVLWVVFQFLILYSLEI